MAAAASALRSATTTASPRPASPAGPASVIVLYPPSVSSPAAVWLGSLRLGLGLRLRLLCAAGIGFQTRARQILLQLRLPRLVQALVLFYRGGRVVIPQREREEFAFAIC